MNDDYPVGDAVPDRGARTTGTLFSWETGNALSLSEKGADRRKEYLDDMTDHDERHRLIHLPPSIHGLVSRVERKYRRKTMEESIEMREA